MTYLGKTARIGAVLVAIICAAPIVTELHAQVLPPALSAGGIAGAVGGGQAAGAQAPIVPPPVAPIQGYGGGLGVAAPNAAINPGSAGLIRPTVLSSRRITRRVRVRRRR